MSEYFEPVLPRPPEAAAPFRFPVLGTVAPVVVALVLWAMTGSVFSLMFAALGPVTAVAGLADARWSARRTRRRELVRFHGECDELERILDQIAFGERAALDEEIPDASAIVARRGPDPARWSSRVDGVRVSLGRARGSSSRRLDRGQRGVAGAAGVDERLDELVRRSAVVDDAPLVVAARLGVGVCGPRAVCESYARGLVVQLAWALSPESHWVSVRGDPGWARALPHASGAAGTREAWAEVGERGGAAAIVIDIASTEAELPGGARIAVSLGGEGALIVRHPDRSERRRVSPAFAGAEQVLAWATDASTDASRRGLAPADAALPSSITLAALLAAPVPAAPSPAPARRGLPAPVAAGPDGPLELDLVAHGPHAIVGGTTGSGKSELLISWVVAMAARSSPEAVTFLLVDFKGGSAFGSVAALPHTVGIITDLDSGGAARALASLRAELRHRERALARLGVRSIDETSELPRLVIVVDEFAAMLLDHPDLHALFADLASRGRSLGVHLVLCTQRPAEAVRDAVLANSDLRISLRVNNPADSTAVVGTDAAANLPAHARGRALVGLAGAPPVTAQFAIAEAADIAGVAARWAGSPRPRRPWCNPLPALVTLGELAASRTAAPDSASGSAPGAVTFGLSDLPHEQRWGEAVWHPARDGGVLVLGAPASGKSAALRALAPLGTRVPACADAAWDALGALVESLDEPRREPGADHIVTIDDVDALLARFPNDHRAVFIERLCRVAREGGAAGVRLALSAQRLTPELGALAGLLPSRLWLRHASKQEFVLAGADGSLFADLPVGAGLWRGIRVQVGWSPAPVSERESARVVPLPTGALAIVSTRAPWLGEQLARDPRNRVLKLAAIGLDASALAAPGNRAVLVGDVDDWQSRWGAIASLRTHASVLFHACSTADFRAISRSRELPPPLSSDPRLCWMLQPDGSAARVRL